MKSRTLAPILAIACFSALFAGAFQDEHVLKLDLKPNTSDKYKVVLHSNQNLTAPGAPPKIEVNGSMDFEVKTGTIDDKGLADVEMKTTNLKLESAEMGGAPEEEIPKEITVKGKLDSRGRITDAKTTGLSTDAQVMMSMMGTKNSIVFVELPEKPVKVGDTWTMMMPEDPMLGSKPKPLTAKLVALKDHDGTPAYEVALEGKFEFDVDMGEIIKKAGDASGFGAMFADVKVKGAIDIAGSAFLARDSGKTLFQQIKIGSKQSMAIMGTEVAMDGTTAITMKLAK